MAAHLGKGDLTEGFGAMSVIDAGEYAGGHLVFPKYRVAVDMWAGDVLLPDVHEYHGNTTIEGVNGEYDRVSTVHYFRRGWTHCLARAAELERAKRPRTGGSPYPVRDRTAPGDPLTSTNGHPMRADVAAGGPAVVTPTH